MKTIHSKDGWYKYSVHVDTHTHTHTYPHIRHVDVYYIHKLEMEEQ